MNSMLIRLLQCISSCALVACAHTLWRKWMGCSRPQPGCQWLNFSWPGILFTSVGRIKPFASPEFSRNFWKLVCCTCPHAGIFLEILLPQCGIFKKVRCSCSQTGVFRDYSLSQPRTILKFIAFPRKKNCQQRPSVYQADVFPLPPILTEIKIFFCYFPKTKLWFMIIV